MVEVLSWVSLVCSAVPAALFLRNLRDYRVAPAPGTTSGISVLIPARNEEAGIAAAIESVASSIGVDWELLILDDNSDDGTSFVVAGYGRRDARIRLLSGAGLPSGWCGKQHACWQLARQASYNQLCFLDADVRLTPDALARIAAFAHTSGSPLVSGFPQELTGTWLEKLLLPLIHFALLGFLPLSRMRASTDTSFAAGCGQLMFAQRDAYFQSGGHAAIRSSLHDGLKLPKAFRKSGFRTDLFDATDIAACRMYRNAKEVWNGLAKNATEGIAAPGRIVPVSILLCLGQVLPFLLVTGSTVAQVAAVVALLPRLLGAWRFRQSLVSAFLHPFGITVLLILQWYAFLRARAGKPAGWKGRVYSDGAGERT